MAIKDNCSIIVKSASSLLSCGLASSISFCKSVCHWSVKYWLRVWSALAGSRLLKYLKVSILNKADSCTYSAVSFSFWALISLAARVVKLLVNLSLLRAIVSSIAPCCASVNCAWLKNVWIEPSI